MNKENFRYYIKVRTALNIPASAIYDELYSVHGDQAPSNRAVRRSAQWFREDRKEIEDEARSGRPITETTSENIEQVRLLIDDDPHITIEEKATTRYIPKDLTDFQRTERVRICKQNLAKFQEGTWRLCDIITGYESWFYHTQIGRKSSNAA
ncbi:unnamed protein product [Rotaria sp. Silwood2]|nr:unnamed protein product [Rotaria sp. Silwood2]CAF4647286.1 unnamed protein product [Rotaria sp. Silwood2]